MKKILFSLALVLCAHLLMAVAIERVTSNSIRFFNFSTASFSLLNMQLTINAQVYEINNLNIKKSGPLDVTPGGRIEFDGLTIPSGGASIALWYPGTFPGTPTSLQMASFFQFGSAGHEYEAVAVQAGLWTAGTFMSGMPPFIRDGNYSTWGAGNWSTGLNINELVAKKGVKLHPNPFNKTLQIAVEDGEIDEVQLISLTGRVVIQSKAIRAKEVELNTETVSNGVFLLRTTLKDGTVIVSKISKY